MQVDGFGDVDLFGLLITSTTTSGSVDGCRLGEQDFRPRRSTLTSSSLGVSLEVPATGELRGRGTRNCSHRAFSYLIAALYTTACTYQAWKPRTLWEPPASYTTSHDHHGTLLRRHRLKKAGPGTKQHDISPKTLSTLPTGSDIPAGVLQLLGLT